MPDEPALHVVVVGSPDPLAMTNLVTGAMIGASGALVAAIILGLFEWVRRRLDRGEQIAFVREFIVAEFTKIRDREPLPPPPDGSPAPPVHDLHWLIYQGLLRDLEVAISYRLTMLDYGKTHDLRSVLARQRDRNRNLFNRTEARPPFNFYRDYYEEFRGIRWLRLPSGLFPVPNSLP